MQPQLEDYHHAWLTLHTNRDALWLKDKLTEGFDVHHIDGDHSNNDPHNLVLIEHLDHMRMHGAVMGKGRLGFVSKKGPRRPRRKITHHDGRTVTLHKGEHKPINREWWKDYTLSS